MITNVDILKEALYERIASINDENILLAIQTIVDNIKTDAVDGFATQKRDLTSYIKEWAKSI